METTRVLPLVGIAVTSVATQPPAAHGQGQNITVGIFPLGAALENIT